MTFKYLTGDILPVPNPDLLDRMPSEHLPTCFGCGSQNPDGMHIVPRYEGNRVVADLTFDKRFEGGPGLVHGGASAALMDDLIGFVMIAHQNPGVTANLSVNYLRPIPLGEKLTAEAWMTKIHGRKMYAEAVLRDGNNVHYLETTGLFLSVGPEHFQKGAFKSFYESDEYYP